MPVGKKAVDRYFKTAGEPVEDLDSIDYKRINARYSGVSDEPDPTSEEYWSDSFPSLPVDQYAAYEE